MEICTNYSILEIDVLQPYKKEIKYENDDEKNETLNQIAERVSYLYSKLYTSEGYYQRFPTNKLPGAVRFPDDVFVIAFKKAIKEEFVNEFKENEEDRPFVMIIDKDLNDQDVLGRAIQKIKKEHRYLYSHFLVEHAGITNVMLDKKAKKIFVEIFSLYF